MKKLLWALLAFAPLVHAQTYNQTNVPPAVTTGLTALSGPLKANTSSALSVAVASDIYGLWSGTCSGGHYLGGGGACVSAVQQMGISSCGTAVATGVTNALAVGACGTPVATANAGQRQQLAATSGTFLTLYASQSTTPTSATTSVYTLVVNSSNTAVTCTIAAAATTCNDTTHTAAITAGQAYWITVNNSSASSTGNVIAGILFSSP